MDHEILIQNIYDRADLTSFQKYLEICKVFEDYNIKDDYGLTRWFHFRQLGSPQANIIEYETWKNPQLLVQKEYWYYLVWTHNDDHTIQEVYTNIEKLVGRSEKLGIYFLDVSYEKDSAKNGREHYNMRIRSNKAIPKNRFSHYEKCGHIHYQPIRKKEEDNWNNLGNYCSKETKIIRLI